MFPSNVNKILVMSDDLPISTSIPIHLSETGQLLPTPLKKKKRKNTPTTIKTAFNVQCKKGLLL